MYVYVISAGPNRQKIGKGRDPEERRRMLQTGNCDALALTFAARVTNALGVESLAHRLLAEKRLQGEWFEATEDEAACAVRNAVAELQAEDNSPLTPAEYSMPRKIVDGVGLEARRSSVRKYHAKREASGLKKATLWLTPESRFKLDALKAAHGSKDAVVNAALAAYQGPGAAVVAVKPVKAVSGPEKRAAVKAEAARAYAAYRESLSEPEPKFKPHPKPGKGPKK